VPLGVTYMCTGRALFLMRKYDRAVAEYRKAEAIFVDEFGRCAVYGSVRNRDSPSIVFFLVFVSPSFKPPLPPTGNCEN
jgi:hypothetical protein